MNGSETAEVPHLPPAIRHAGWAAVSLTVFLLALAILQVDDIMSLFWLGSVVNVALSVTKMGLAQATVHHKALMADAVHGLGDTAAEVVTALAYAEAARPPDKEHPWGHGKIESMGAVGVTGILLYIAFSMGYDSIVSLAPLLREQAHGRDAKPVAKDATPMEEAPGSDNQSKAGIQKSARRAAIAVGLASILLKEALYRATLSAGEQVQSNLAVATAWHHRSDSLAAGVALASQLGGAVGAWQGFDPLGSGVVAAMLGVSAVDSLRDSLNDLLDYNHATGEFEYISEDGSADAASGVCYGAALSRNIGTVQGVRSHTLRTRRMGRFCLADVTIVVDARISASAASMIAEAVHDQVIRDFHPIVTDVLVHVDPDGSPQSHRLETHSEVGNMADQMMMNPEELEAQIREALLQEDADKDLPSILEVKELQTYFYMEEDTSAGGDGKLTSYVDVKVDFRLQGEDTTIRRATAAGRAARERVHRALPGIVRDVDVNLQLDMGEEEGAFQAAASATATSKVLPAAACGSPGDQRKHGSWRWDFCSRPSAALASSVPGGLNSLVQHSDRRLRQVKLIWQRGPEARKAPGYKERVSWRPFGGNSSSPAYVNESQRDRHLEEWM